MTRITSYELKDFVDEDGRPDAADYRCSASVFINGKNEGVFKYRGRRFEERNEVWSYTCVYESRKGNRHVLIANEPYLLSKMNPGEIIQSQKNWVLLKFLKENNPIKYIFSLLRFKFKIFKKRRKFNTPNNEALWLFLKSLQKISYCRKCGAMYADEVDLITPRFQNGSKNNLLNYGLYCETCHYERKSKQKHNRRNLWKVNTLIIFSALTLLLSYCNFMNNF